MSKMICLLCGNDSDRFIEMGNGRIVCLKCANNVNKMLAVESDFLNDNEETLAVGGYDYVSNEVKETKNGRKPSAQEISYEKLMPYKPSNVKKGLDEYIIGQEKAKKVISVAAYNHVKRSRLKDNDIQKSNILLMGPTGCGKTLIAKTLGKILDVPVAIVPATTLTEAGYIGDDVTTVVERLVKAAGGNIEKAQNGIIFIDEIDKLASERSGVRREVGGKGVQQALLPILEGTKVTVTISSGMNDSAKVEVDTSNILFIVGGAFPDLENIIRRRLAGKSTIGFTGESKQDVKDNVMLKATTDDLKEFGLIPEFLGRLPVITALEELDVATLKKILTEPKDSIVYQYQKLFSVDFVQLTFDDDALTVIAEKAKEKGTGARSLRGLLEDLLLDLMYEIPDKKDVREILITVDFVEGKGRPIYSPASVNYSDCNAGLVVY